MSPDMTPTGWRWENPLPTGSTLRAAWAAAPDDVWAVGDGGTLLHFDGRTWSGVSSPVAASLTAVWGSAPTDVWAAGEGGTLIHYDGTSWSQAVSGTTAPLGVLSGTAADDVWVSSAAIPVQPQVTTGGAAPDAVLLHYDGCAWTRVEAYAPTAVAALARDDVWVGGVAALRHFDGSSWTTFTAPGGFVRALAGLHRGPVFAITETTVPCSPKSGVLCGEGTLLRFDRSSWTTQGPSPGMLVAAAGTVWSLDRSGWDQLSRYDGNRWVTVASAAAFEQSAWAQSVAPVSREQAWIVGRYGRRMFFDGKALSEPDASRTNTIRAMSGSSECDVWAVGDELLVLHRGCDGKWSSVDLTAMVAPHPGSDPAAWRRLFSVATFAPDVVWIHANDRILSFDGVGWSAEPAPADGHLFAVARDELYLAGSAGLFRRDGSGWHYLFGGGDFWSRVGEYMLEVWASSSKDVWVLAQDQKDQSFVLYHFDGTSWSISLRRSWAGSAAITGTAADDVWFATGELLHYEGSSWKTIPGPVEVGGVVALGRGEVWAAGWGASGWGAYLVDANGVWRLRSTPSVPLISGAMMFLFGEGGAILSQPK